MTPPIMNLLRLPQLRRRDHEDADDKEVHGTQVAVFEPDLLLDEDVDEEAERHMFLPSYRTTFWGTSMAFFLSPSLTAQPPSPTERSFEIAVEAIESPTASGEFDSMSESAMREGDDDRTCRQDLKANIKLSGELYPRYSLDKFTQFNKLADFSVAKSQEPGSLEACRAKNRLAPRVSIVPAEADENENGQENSKVKQKKKFLNKMSEMPMWSRANQKASKVSRQPTTSPGTDNLVLTSPLQIQLKGKPQRLWGFTSLRRIKLQ